MIRRLEIGPGTSRLPGDWVTVDCVARAGTVDFVCRWGEEPLPFSDETFDLVYASHVLEHVPWYHTVDALREVWRILAAEGTIELHVPDFDVLARAALRGICLDDHAENDLNVGLHWMHWVAERLLHLGADHEWHKACFNAEHLKWCLERAGFSSTSLEVLKSERGKSHGVINLGMVAVKSASEKPRPSLIPTTPTEETRTMASRADANVDPGIKAGLPYCHSRRQHDPTNKVFFCGHPQVHTEGSLVTTDICGMCTQWQEKPPEEFRPPTSAARTGPCWFLGPQIGFRKCRSCRADVKIKVFDCGHPAHDTTTFDECLRCADYEPRLKRGAVSSWAVGVTTAPRRQSTIQRTLECLRHAGWETGRIFAEPESYIPEKWSGFPVTRRETTLGAWPNWFLGLSELYQRDPKADAYLMVQDDVVFCKNSRTYLERVLWPSETLGVVSLYNPLEMETTRHGFVLIDGAPGLPGALALIFPNYAARLLLGDSTVIAHRRRGPTSGTQLIDVVVGEWATKLKLAAFCHVPSLTQHIGESTTIWPAAQDTIPRQASRFVGEDFDAVKFVR